MQTRCQILGFTLLSAVSLCGHAELQYVKGAIVDVVRDHLYYWLQDYIEDNRNEWRYDGEYYHYKDRKYRRRQLEYLRHWSRFNNK